MNSDHFKRWELIESHLENLRPVYDAIRNSPQMPLALYGAGATGKQALSYLSREGRSVNYFLDNAAGKSGWSIAGIPVVRLTEANLEDSHVLLTTRSGISGLSKELREKGITHLSFLAYFVLDNLARYRVLRNSFFEDDESIRTLDGLLLAILTNDPAYCVEIVSPTQYFCLPHFQNVGGDIFVDAGAYVGETSEQFLWFNQGIFRGIHLFEPGGPQFRAIQARMRRLTEEWALDPGTIFLNNTGVAQKTGWGQIDDSTGVLAAMSIRHDPHLCQDSDGTKLWSLDDYLTAYDGQATFIKADIEGMELPFLLGAVQTIRKHRPKLAISAYHTPWDLLEIPEMIHSLDLGYTFALRHHSLTLSETVLYGWVPKY